MTGGRLGGGLGGDAYVIMKRGRGVEGKERGKKRKGERERD